MCKLWGIHWEFGWELHYEGVMQVWRHTWFRNCWILGTYATSSVCQALEHRPDLSVILAARGEVECTICSPIIQDVCSLLNDISHLGILWIRRSCNLVAHELARHVNLHKWVIMFQSPSRTSSCLSGLADLQHLYIN